MGPTPQPFHLIASTLSTADRKALLDAIWSGQTTVAVADRVALPGDYLFYVAFMGSKRDHIPTQHYLIPASDERTAAERGHELYEKEPRRRKGSALRLMIGTPPQLRRNH